MAITVTAIIISRNVIAFLDLRNITQAPEYHQSSSDAKADKEERSDLLRII